MDGQLTGLRATADRYVAESCFGGQRGCSSLKAAPFPRRYRQLKQQCELKVEEEQILQAKVQQSSFHQQQEELERLRTTIGEQTQTPPPPDSSNAP